LPFGPPEESECELARKRSFLTFFSEGGIDLVQGVPMIIEDAHDMGVSDDEIVSAFRKNLPGFL
jgi:hypothetical protein